MSYPYDSGDPRGNGQFGLTHQSTSSNTRDIPEIAWRSNNENASHYVTVEDYSMNKDGTSNNSSTRVHRGKNTVNAPHFNSSDSRGGDPEPTEDTPEKASEIRARLAREQWEDYKNRFQPYEDRLKTLYESGGLLEGELESIKPNVDAAFDSTRGMVDRNNARYGVEMSADEKANRHRALALSQTAATAGGYNRLWQVGQSRRDQIMTGSAGRSQLGD